MLCCFEIELGGKGGSSLVFEQTWCLVAGDYFHAVRPWESDNQLRAGHWGYETTDQADAPPLTQSMLWCHFQFFSTLGSIQLWMSSVSSSSNSSIHWHSQCSAKSEHLSRKSEICFLKTANKVRFNLPEKCLHLIFSVFILFSYSPSHTEIENYSMYHSTRPGVDNVKLLCGRTKGFGLELELAWQ